MEPHDHGTQRLTLQLECALNTICCPGFLMQNRSGRARIEVSSSNFPRFDRNLNTGGRNVDETKGLVARNSVHHSRQFPSSLTLTVVKRGVATVERRE